MVKYGLQTKRPPRVLGRRVIQGGVEVDGIVDPSNSHNTRSMLKAG